MPDADWDAVAHQIADDLRALRTDRVLRFHLDELLARSEADQAPDGYNSRSLWASNQRGDPSFRAWRNAGLVLSFEPDERGKPVQFVTFRLDRNRD